MSRKIIDAAGLGFVLRFVTLGLGIVITPLLFRLLDKEELTGWFLVINNVPLLALLDFGLTPTIAKRVALTYGKLSVARSPARRAMLDKRLRQMFSTGKQLFELRSILALVLSVAGGYFYLLTVDISPAVKNQALIGWLIVSVAQAIQIRGAIWSSFLGATGHISVDTSLSIVMAVLDICARVVVVLLGGGIIALSIVSAVAVIARRYASSRIALRRMPQWVGMKEPFSRPLVMSMARAMFSVWLMGVGAYLLMRTDQYFIVGMLEPTMLASYQGTYQIYSTLWQFALITAGSAGAFLSHYWAAGQHESFRKAVVLSLQIGSAITWMGAATLLAVGPSFFTLWLGQGNFVGLALLAAFSVTIIIETQQMILTNADRATENESYGHWLLICGVLNIGVTWLMAHFFGLLGVALATSISIMLTTGWVSAYRAHRNLKVSAWTTVIPTQLKTGIAAAALYGLLRGVQALIGADRLPHEVNAALGLIIGPLALAAWLWLGVFKADDRARLVRYARERLGLAALAKRRGEP